MTTLVVSRNASCQTPNHMSVNRMSCCNCAANSYCEMRGTGCCYNGVPLVKSTAPNYLSDETVFAVRNIPTTGGSDRFILEFPTDLLQTGQGNTEPALLSYGTPSATVEMYTRHGGYIRTDMLVRAITQRLHRLSPCVYGSAFRFRAVYASDPNRVNIIDCLPCTILTAQPTPVPDEESTLKSNSVNTPVAANAAASSPKKA